MGGGVGVCQPWDTVGYLEGTHGVLEADPVVSLCGDDRTPAGGVAPVPERA